MVRLIERDIGVKVQAQGNIVIIIGAGNLAAFAKDAINAFQSVAIAAKGKFALVIKAKARKIAIMAGDESMDARRIEPPASNLFWPVNQRRADQRIDVVWQSKAG